MEREYGFCNDKIFYVMQEEWIEKRDVKWDQLGRLGSVLNTWEKIKFKKILFICLCLNNSYKEQTSPRFCSLIIWTGDLAKMYCTEAPFWPAFPHLVPWKLWNGQVGGKDLKCTCRSHPSRDLGRVQELHLDPGAGKLCQIPQYSHALSRAQEDRETISGVQLGKRQSSLPGGAGQGFPEEKRKH